MMAATALASGVVGDQAVAGPMARQSQPSPLLPRRRASKSFRQGRPASSCPGPPLSRLVAPPSLLILWLLTRLGRMVPSTSWPLVSLPVPLSSTSQRASPPTRSTWCPFALNLLTALRPGPVCLLAPSSHPPRLKISPLLFLLLPKLLWICPGRLPIPLEGPRSQCRSTTSKSKRVTASSSISPQPQQERAVPTSHSTPRGPARYQWLLFAELPSLLLLGLSSLGELPLSTLHRELASGPLKVTP